VRGLTTDYSETTDINGHAAWHAFFAHGLRGLHGLLGFTGGSAASKTDPFEFWDDNIL